MIKRILVGLAGTDYTPIAMQTAIDLAQQHEAQVTGVTIFNAEKVRLVGSVPIGAGGVANALRDQRLAEVRDRIDAVISDFEEACEKASVKHNVCREESGEMCSTLVSESRYHDVSVLGLRGVFDYLHHHDETDCTAQLIKLISSGVRPIVTVPKESFTVERVMIAFSGGVESAKTMKRFIQLHPWGRTPLKIVTFEHSPSKAEQLLIDAAAYCEAHGFDVETEYIHASPIEALLPAAEDWGADVIVLGNSSRSILLRRVLGETCLHAIKHSTTPLFLCQ